MRYDVARLMENDAPSTIRFGSTRTENSAAYIALGVAQAKGIDVCVLEVSQKGERIVQRIRTPRPVNFRPMHFDPRWHQQSCRYRIASECAVPVACRHGFDVCSECDPCTCILALTPVEPQR